MAQTEYRVTLAGAWPPLRNITLLVSSFPLVTLTQLNTANAALNSHTRHYSKAGVPPFRAECVENYLSLINSLITLVVVARSKDSSVSIVTDCGMDGRGLIPNRSKVFFSTPPHPDRSGAPTSLLSNGVLGNESPAVKRPRLEADHLPPFSAEVKNGGTISSLPHMSSWHGAKLI
jgi:hypothetical protein